MTSKSLHAPASPGATPRDRATLSPAQPIDPPALSFVRTAAGSDEASRSSAAAAGYRSAVLSNWIHTVVGIDNRELWFDTTVAAIDRVIWWRYQAAGSIDKCDGRDVSISRVQVQQAEVSWARTAAMTVCVCLNEASFFFFFFFFLLLLCFPSLSCITSKLWHCKLTFVS